ncbi:transglutaminase domain-containing protein [Streptomyces sp. SB3404]|uniref:Transglutaminase domain-containing protein n=1 Tax=Streptomyces boncukensis TaxID=2711219 RepID=A0A6G4X2D6_9ACTN|nr:transglutaminase domain-containing protein [Streptomyces boncukensis]
MATLAAASTLLPLVDPATWILQAALLVGIQTGVGAVARRVPLARPVTVLVQALAALLMLTLMFARQEALGGLLPSPAVFDRFGDLLSAGGQDVSRFAIPAPVTDGIRLMLVGGVLAVGLLVDALAVTYRSAAPAGLPLLALYSVAAGLSDGGSRWLWFLAAAGGFLLLLLAEGRERLAQWGRIFADRSRPGSAPYSPAVGGTAVAPVRTGRRIGVLALGIALVVPAVLPSMSGGLLESARERNAGSGGDGGKITAVRPEVSLQDSLNQPENRTVLTYTTDTEETQELYMRIVALDDFDGSTWKSSERRITSIPEPMPTPKGLAPEVKTQTVRTKISAAGWYAQDWLPMPYPANRVGINGKWRFEPEGRTLVGYQGQTTRGVRYQVESLLVEPTARQLRQAPEPAPEIEREYTRVPDSLPSVVHETARRVTRGATDDYQRAVKLQDWFAREGGFRYDTQVRSGTGSAAIANFLENKEGFCIHFSYSMAAMARTLGIPARVAVGFIPGAAEGDGSIAVGLQDAHAWPELYFEGVGWTRFEPTPTRGTTPSYARQDAPDRDADPSERLPDPGQDASPSPSPSASDQCTPEEKRSNPDCGAALPAADSGAGSGGFPAETVAAVTGGVLLALLLPSLPLLWRTRKRARRLREPPAGAGPDAVAASVVAVWRELLDSGWDFGIVPEDSATPRTAAARIARIGELGEAETEAAHRVALAVERVLYAPAPRGAESAGPAEGLADEVRRVRAGLWEAAPRRLRLRALLLPPSTVRALWAASSWWAAVRRRATPRLRRA